MKRAMAIVAAHERKESGRIAWEAGSFHGEPGIVDLGEID